MRTFSLQHLGVAALKPLSRCLSIALAMPVAAAVAHATDRAPPSAHIRAILERTPPAVPADSVAVTNCNDSGPGSLRDAATNAVDGETIDLTQTGCSEITLTTGSIVIAANSLTLQGPGALSLTISGDYIYSPLEHIQDGVLAVNDLTIRDGHKYFDNEQLAPAKGGCVSSNGTVSLSHTWVTNCHVNNSSGSYGALGGGVYAYTAVSMSNSVVTDNRASAYRQYAYGGGVYSHGSLTVIDSVISGNVTEMFLGTSAGAGAAVGYHNRSGRDSVIKYSTIDGNEANGYLSDLNIGGGLVLTGDVTILATTVSNNVADYTGGLVLKPDSYTSAPWILQNSTISGNQAARGMTALFSGANAIDISNSTIAFNETYGLLYGSALFIQTTADLESTIVVDNVQIGAERQENDIGGASGATLTGAGDLIGFSLLGLPGDTIRTDPLLQPLAYNGGPTRTHALPVGSAAVDAGNDVAGLTYDQRGGGHPRVIGSGPDIGAFELDPDAIFANGFD